MSTIKADNFGWKTGLANGVPRSTVTGDQIVYGVAKAWSNFSQSTPGINKSYNLSSIVATTTYATTTNYTAPFADIFYSITLAHHFQADSSSAGDGGISPAVSSYQANPQGATYTIVSSLYQGTGYSCYSYQTIVSR